MAKFKESEIELSNGTSFKIKHNMTLYGPVNSLQAAFDCWIVRTSEYTAESFVEYINSKGMYKAEVISQ
jgi:hypothetical protein